MRHQQAPAPVQIGEAEPPAYLGHVPTDVLFHTRPGVLGAWLAARHWRPTGLQVEAERRRRRNTDPPATSVGPMKGTP